MFTNYVHILAGASWILEYIHLKVCEDFLFILQMFCRQPRDIWGHRLEIQAWDMFILCHCTYLIKKICSYFYDIYILKISTFESIADLFDVTMKGRPTYVTLGKTSIRLRLRVSTNTGAQHFLQEFTSVQCTKSYRFNESLFLSLCFYFRENATSTSELNHCVCYLV